MTTAYEEGKHKADLAEMNHDMLTSRVGRRNLSGPMAFNLGLAFLALCQQRGQELINLKEDLLALDLFTYLREIEAMESRLIEDLSSKYTSTELRAFILFVEANHYYRGHESLTPLGLSKLAIEILDLQPGDRVMDMGSGLGSFLTEASQTQGLDSLYGLDINEDNLRVARLRAYEQGQKINYLEKNILSGDLKTYEANKIFTNFPLGMRFSDSEEALQQNAFLQELFKKESLLVSHDWVFVLAAYAALKEGGRAVCVMANSGTWNRADIQLRQYLVEKNAIEALIALAPNLLSGSSVPINLLVLGKNEGKIRLVDATGIYTKGWNTNLLEDSDIAAILEAYKSGKTLSRDVDREELKAKNYELYPTRYLDQPQEWGEGLTLGDLVKEINRGAPLKLKELEDLVVDRDTGNNYLMIQHIRDGLIEGELPALREIERKYRPYCLRENNLILSRLYPFKVARFTGFEGRRILATGNLFFLDVDEDAVDPVYLESYLQSELGQLQLNRAAKGSAIKSINVKDLSQIKIPKAARYDQERRADRYEELLQQQAQLEARLKEIKEEKARLFSRD